MVKKEIKLIKNGKRVDGRDLLEFREIEMKVDVIPRADGSAKVSFGNTMVVASVYGPRALFPKHLQEKRECVVRCRYAMAPFSVEERKSPGPDRRSIEISKIIRQAIEAAVFVSEFPRATIDVFVEVLNADGSTRIASTNAASLALACAGIPMKDLICAVSVGKIDGKLIVDLNGIEDNNSECDLNFAILPSKNEVSLFQMDGLLTKDELFKLLDIAKKKCTEIYEMQKKVLREKYG
jgi:exosome complex component RRP41